MGAGSPFSRMLISITSHIQYCV